jgi:hypothetical protein
MTWRSTGRRSRQASGPWSAAPPGHPPAGRPRAKRPARCSRLRRQPHDGQPAPDRPQAQACSASGGGAADLPGRPEGAGLRLPGRHLVGALDVARRMVEAEHAATKRGTDDDHRFRRGSPVRQSTVVRVPLARRSTFVRTIDAWWPKRYSVGRAGPPPRAGATARWADLRAVGRRHHPRVGRARVWGRRPSSCQLCTPAPESSSRSGRGPAPHRVAVEHRGWEALTAAQRGGLRQARRLPAAPAPGLDHALERMARTVGGTVKTAEEVVDECVVLYTPADDVMPALGTSPPRMERQVRGRRHPADDRHADVRPTARWRSSPTAPRQAFVAGDPFVRHGVVVRHELRDWDGWRASGRSSGAGAARCPGSQPGSAWPQRRGGLKPASPVRSTLGRGRSSTPRQAVGAIGVTAPAGVSRTRSPVRGSRARIWPQASYRSWFFRSSRW